MDSGCGSIILLVRIIQNNNPKEEAMMQWHTQAGKITNNIKFKIDFTLTALSAK